LEHERVLAERDQKSARRPLDETGNPDRSKRIAIHNEQFGYDRTKRFFPGEGGGRDREKGDRREGREKGQGKEDTGGRKDKAKEESRRESIETEERWYTDSLVESAQAKPREADQSVADQKRPALEWIGGFGKGISSWSMRGSWQKGIRNQHVVHWTKQATQIVVKESQ
jgi:hypothetical protein